MPEDHSRFSLIYLDRGEPVRDSVRFRNRLSAYYSEKIEDFRSTIHNAIKRVIARETGCELPYSGYGPDIPEFFQNNELRDVLDSITLIYKTIKNHNYGRAAGNWRDFVSRIFREENIGYQLDGNCVVHYFVDEEFERNRFATLSVLDSPVYNGSKAAFEDAYRHMDSDPMDTKAAVRSMFESIEILVKDMTGSQLLNRRTVDNTLKQMCLELYSSDPTASNVTSKFFDGFADWVDGLHNYRHGQTGDEPVAPPEEITIYVLSTGSSFLRWLIIMNNKLVE